MSDCKSRALLFAAVTLAGGFLVAPPSMALAADAELLVADDVSSALDAATEVELWAALRARGTTVLGATSKRSALAQADRVVVLVDGEIAAVGPWTDLAPQWGHLAG